jgi:hypothetical protein
LCVPPYDCGKWDKLTIGMLLDALKKQNINISQVKNIFTFYDIEFLGETNTNDVLWQAFDYDRIDMRYDTSYDQIMILDNKVFFYLKALY